MEDAGTVDLPQERLRSGAVLRHDALSVAASVAVDVVDRRLKPRHHLQRHRQAAVLVVRARRRLQGKQPLCQEGAPAQHLRYRGKEAVQR